MSRSSAVAWSSTASECRPTLEPESERSFDAGLAPRPVASRTADRDPGGLRYQLREVARVRQAPRMTTLGGRSPFTERLGCKIQQTASDFLYDPSLAERRRTSPPERISMSARARRRYVTERGKCKRTKRNLAHGF